MGFQTIVTINNDFWDQLKKNPEKLVESISPYVSGMMGSNDRYAHYYPLPQGIHVTRPFHASESPCMLGGDYTLLTAGTWDTTTRRWMDGQWGRDALRAKIKFARQQLKNLERELDEAEGKV